MGQVNMLDTLKVLRDQLYDRVVTRIEPYDYNGFYVECADSTEFVIEMHLGEQWCVHTNVDRSRIGLV